MKSLAVLVLRFTEPGNRAWKVPGNLHIGKIEIPVGLILISGMLFITAIVNLFTKYEATIAGLIFSGVFFTIFTISEHHVTKERHGKPEQLDQFRVYGNGCASRQCTGCGPRPTESLLPPAHHQPHEHRQAGRRSHERALVSSRTQFQWQFGV